VANHTCFYQVFRGERTHLGFSRHELVKVVATRVDSLQGREGRNSGETLSAVVDVAVAVEVFVIFSFGHIVLIVGNILISEF